jgi:hypothetical protein
MRITGAAMALIGLGGAVEPGLGIIEGQAHGAVKGPLVALEDQHVVGLRLDHPRGELWWREDIKTRYLGL